MVRFGYRSAATSGGRHGSSRVPTPIAWSRDSSRARSSSCRRPQALAGTPEDILASHFVTKHFDVSKWSYPVPGRPYRIGMQSSPLLNSIPDDELLQRLAALLRSSRHTEADLVAHIGEVDARRLYAREASPSMWAYCTKRLHLSGAEAYLRIAAARASRQHPIILEMLADGRLHLTAIALLAPHLTLENAEVLLRRATHTSKREVEELLAEIEPRPDVPALIRKLPDRRSSAGNPAPRSPAAAIASAAEIAPLSGGPGATAPSSAALSAGTAPSDPSSTAATAAKTDTVPPSEPVLRLDEVVSSRSAGVSARAAVIEPLSPARYKVQFTASAKLREKLERLQALMRPSIPNGDLAAVIEAAVTEKLERLESRRFGRTKAPRKGIGRESGTPTCRLPRVTSRPRFEEKCTSGMRAAAGSRTVKAAGAPRAPRSSTTTGGRSHWEATTHRGTWGWHVPLTTVTWPRSTTAEPRWQGTVEARPRGRRRSRARRCAGVVARQGPRAPRRWEPAQARSGRIWCPPARLGLADLESPAWSCGSGLVWSQVRQAVSPVAGDPEGARRTGRPASRYRPRPQPARATARRPRPPGAASVPPGRALPPGRRRPSPSPGASPPRCRGP